MSLWRWLADPASLTQRVIEACSGRFHVAVRHQGWGRPLRSEAGLLRCRRTGTALIREVELCCGDLPWVFARTVLPAGSLRGGARQLARLGERPLGAVLFAEPSTRRGVTQVARLLPHHPLFAAATDHLLELPDELWARRTVFFFARKPLLVNEIFLPGIPLRPGA